MAVLAIADRLINLIYSIFQIFDMGHSRVPVFCNDRQHVLGVFLTKRVGRMPLTAA